MDDRVAGSPASAAQRAWTEVSVGFASRAPDCTRSRSTAFQPVFEQERNEAANLAIEMGRPH
jgi:hypothetical protein